ncbi:MAG: 16S rRNA (cytosine(1402)-N(4))-methyltransferase RsmH [Pseudomonadota bacterium]|nr:16S rRNA (cytosine(1402)-N(4))-methyltransferase RsmH [Pseudomonadota bacterium]
MPHSNFGGHIPVMINEVVSALKPSDKTVYIDGTFGRGGYSKALLKLAATKVIGLDRDPEAVRVGTQLEKEFGGRFKIIHGCFSKIDELICGEEFSQVDGVVLDLGPSSPQLDDPNRGFSFRSDGPLDMRMSKDGTTAADLVNNISEKEIANIIWSLGEERHSRRIAKEIVRVRSNEPILTTGQLANLVRRVVRTSNNRVDAATRTFMAFRIKVNDELNELKRGLCAAENILAPGGILAVVTFHSLEDRIVKDFLRSRSGFSAKGSRHFPELEAQVEKPSFQLSVLRATKPSKEEIAANKRARSARLRVAERTTSPSWSHNYSSVTNSSVSIKGVG